MWFFGILESVCAPSSIASMAVIWPDQEWGSWDWDKTIEKVFTIYKWAVQQAKALQVTDPGKPFELNVHVTAEGYGWGIW